MYHPTHICIYFEARVIVFLSAFKKQPHTMDHPHWRINRHEIYANHKVVGLIIANYGNI